MCGNNSMQTFLDASRRIGPFITSTALTKSAILEQETGAAVYLKLENRQYTGSFKVRGALNSVLQLSNEERVRGVVAASTGNHGAAVGYAADVVGTGCIVFVPENASRSKLKNIEKYGGTVKFHGQDSTETELFAREHAEDQGMKYISPYNDEHVIVGQGTIGVELCEQLSSVDVVMMALGGGGLISGIGEYMKLALPDVELIACSPEHSNVMMASVQAGRILDVPSLPTLSDGTAGGVEHGAITFSRCQRLVDRFVSTTEPDIEDGIRFANDHHEMVIEGAAGVVVAACRKIKQSLQGKTVVIVICGGNIDQDIFDRITHTI